MKMTSLVDVYRTVKGVQQEEILMDSDTIQKAKVCIDRMIALG